MTSTNSFDMSELFNTLPQGTIFYSWEKGAKQPSKLVHCLNIVYVCNSCKRQFTTQHDIDQHDCVKPSTKATLEKSKPKGPINKSTIRKPAQLTPSKTKVEKDPIMAIYEKHGLSLVPNRQKKQKLEVVCLEYASDKAKAQGYQEAFAEYEQLTDEPIASNKPASRTCVCSQVIDKYHRMHNVVTDKVLVVGVCCAKRIDEEGKTQRDDDFIVDDDEIEYEYDYGFSSDEEDKPRYLNYNDPNEY